MERPFKNYSEFLTVEEVARLLRVSPLTIYRMVERGSLPGFKVGRQWRFDKSEVAKFLSQGKIITRPKPSARRYLFSSDVLAYYRTRMIHQVKATPRGGWIIIRTNENEPSSPTIKIRFRKVRLTDGQEAIVLSRAGFNKIPVDQRVRWKRMRR